MKKSPLSEFLWQALIFFRWNHGRLKQFYSTCTQIDYTSRWRKSTTVFGWRANANWNISDHSWKSDSAAFNYLVKTCVFYYFQFMNYFSLWFFQLHQTCPTNYYSKCRLPSSVPSHPVLSYLTCPALPCPTLPCPTLTDSILACLHLPQPSLLYFTLLYTSLPCPNDPNYPQPPLPYSTQTRLTNHTLPTLPLAHFISSTDPKLRLTVYWILL